MSLVDPSEILLDPDLVSQFSILRRAETVSQQGRGVLSTLQYPVIGNVQATGSNSLVRADGYSQQLKTIKVVTRFRLRGVAVQINNVNYQPDLVVWRGETFIVKMLEDYSEYGHGFVEAECESFVYVGPPPQWAPTNVNG